MTRGRLVTAAIATVLAAAVVPAAIAAIGPPAGNGGALSMRVVSSPPALVSGGDARVEVTVPATVPLSSVMVTLDGSDVSAAFAHPVVVGHDEGRWTARAKATRIIEP